MGSVHISFIPIREQSIMSEIRVPSLGESIVEAIVSKWLKQEGESVASGEPVVELETDKVNLEVAAEQDGTIESIAKPEGATVEIGDVLATLGAANGKQQAAAPAQEQQQEAPPQREPAPAQEAPPQREAAPAQTAAGNGQQAQQQSEEEMLATPVALRMAADNNIDIRQVGGSGPGGRVTKEDVMLYIEQRAPTSQPAASRAPAAPQPPDISSSVPQRPQEAPQQRSDNKQAQPATPKPATQKPATPAPPESGERREERQRMSRRRQTIARRLVEAQRTAAMLTTFNEIDMGAVMALRKRRKDKFKEQHGVNLGFMSFFTKAVVGALKAFPLLNAEIQGEELVIKHYYDIGIAVGTEQGLVVPVLRDADRRTFAQIEHGIVELAERARSNTLSLAELQGGTFSITNGGIYGSLMSTPILNAPQVGILGLHKIEERPVAHNGEIAIRPMMYVALSYDHRIVDGSEAVRFLVRIKELVEDPEALLLEG
jgi:2-oxoglutarate dehydrogenase E2 component (dihydrolipoamide succinyltransferase)